MKKIIVMAGTDPATMGGIASVVNVYRAAGLFARYPITYLATHCDGGAGAKLGRMLRAYLRYLWLLCRGRVGLLHVHVASRASFWRKCPLFLLAFVWRVPAILHLHGAEFAVFYGQECGPLRRALVRGVFNRCSQVVVLSGQWQQWVQGIGVTAPVRAVYNPVLLPPAASDWGARQAGQLLFLGRLGPRKGSYDLLAAIARVVAAQPALTALLGGDGELAQTAARADALGIAAHVKLLGWVGGADKQALLDQAMVYVLPSYNEGLPMSVLEAMAAGMPVISTPVGGIPEAVSDGVEGYLVAPGDVAALAERIERLLTEPGLAERMGAAARRKVATTFSAEAVLPRIEELYQQLGWGRP
ncbi:MAG: glycosyltransferase family 4 protein [Pseudomonadota bacterium]